MMGGKAYWTNPDSTTGRKLDGWMLDGMGYIVSAISETPWKITYTRVSPVLVAEHFYKRDPPQKLFENKPREVNTL